MRPYRLPTSWAAVSALALLALPGCPPTEGEVARERECPPGEICSELAPRGLSFASDQDCDFLGGRSLVPTVRGGVQEITVLRGGVSLSLPFRAVSADESVFVVEEVRPPFVQVRGVGEGSALLRILEPDADALLDRIQHRVVALTGPELQLPFFSFPLVDDWEGSAAGVDLPWAMYPGGRGRALLFLDGGAVDAEATVSPGLATDAWCIPELQAEDADFEVTIHAGGEDHVVTVPVDGAVTRLAADLRGGHTTLPPWPLSTEGLLCVVGLGETRVILGVPLAAEATGAVTVTEAEAPGCFHVVPVGVGPGEVRVSGAGVTETFAYDVGAARLGLTESAPEDGSPGDRAASAAP